MKKLFAIALIFALFSCGETPVAPTPVPTPAPTPTPVAAACILDTVVIRPSLDADGERTTPKYEFGTRQTALLLARATNRRLEYLDEACPQYALVTQWLQVSGAGCRLLGPTNTPSVRLKCELSADVLARASMRGSDERGQEITRTGEVTISFVDGSSAARIKVEAR